MTKSGTNQLHGSLYEYNRNTATAANTWLNNQAGVPVATPDPRNQFGGSVGGKIKRDRIFYFFNRLRSAPMPGSTSHSPRGAVRYDAARATSCLQLADRMRCKHLTPQDIRNRRSSTSGRQCKPCSRCLNLYPHGNDPSFGEDGGLNFSGFRFNAPSHRNDRAIVGKLDFHIDSAGKHTVSVRGTLADNTEDQILAQFPGQGPASTLRDASKGLSAQYTWVVKPTFINVFNLGFTRFSPALSGATGPVLFQTSLDPLQNPYARPFGQRLPEPSIHRTIVTWTKGKHTITFGFNARLIHNDTVFAGKFVRPLWIWRY